MVLVLSRGGFCPKDRQQAEGLVELHRELEVAYCRLVTIRACAGLGLLKLHLKRLALREECVVTFISNTVFRLLTGKMATAHER